MKHWLGLVLVLTLLLSGCTPAQEPTTPTDMTQPSQEVTDPSAPTGTQAPTDLTDPEEPRTKIFTVTGFYGMAWLGENILLARDDQGTGELSLLDPTTLEMVKTIRLPDGLVPTWEEMQITDMGIGFYDQERHIMMFWNTNLQELARVTLPGEVMGKAWLSPDWKKSYFCTDQGIYAMDMQTHIDTLLKQNPGADQMITGILAEGTILRYRVRVSSSEQHTYLVDAGTGMRVEESLALDALTTWKDTYYLPMGDGPVRRLLFGTQTAQKLLWPRVEDATIHPVPAANGVVTESAALQDDGATNYELEYYDLESGRRTASVTVKNGRILALLPTEDGKIWSLNGNEYMEGVFLWDLSQTPVEDDQVYVTPYFTADNPDRAGLAALKQELQLLGDQYGITFLLWEDAVNSQPWDYTFEGEFLTQVYRKCLPALKKALSIFPEGFLSKITGNESKKMVVSLVRSIHDIADVKNQRQISGIQYWIGDTPGIALVLGEDLERSMYHQIGLVLDNQVLMRSREYDLWNRRNPSGFNYDNDYIKNLERQDTQYAQNPTRFFLDLFSMSYAKEDRATIFEYACLPGNAEHFTSSAMQMKLTAVCRGIREAYGLKKVPDAFLWEQYLKN